MPKYILMLLRHYLGNSAAMLRYLFQKLLRVHDE